VTQEIPHGVQRDPALNETSGEMVAEVMPTEMADPGALEQFHPGLLKSGRHVKDVSSGS
jgi:hypothetical protein